MPPVPKIAQLPPEIRRWLRETLIDRAFGDIVSVTAELQEMLRQSDIRITVGKSAVGAESLRIKRASAAMKEATESARAIAEGCKDDADLVGVVTQQTLSNQLFDFMLEMEEAKNEIDPAARMKILGSAALASSRLSRGRISQERWRKEIEKEAQEAARKEAANAVDRSAKKHGLQQHQIDAIRADLLGIPVRQAKTNKEA